MDNLSVYRELADRYDGLGQASMRDRFLILAADSAQEAGQPDEAERLRLRLLQGNRHHMLRPYNSFAEATRAADVQTYLRDLRVNYPLDVAQQLLESLQETANSPGRAVHETQPIDWSKPQPGDLPAPIPPTAPLMDLSAPGRTPSSNIAGDDRQEDRSQAASRRPARFDTAAVRDEASPPTARPLAQPLPPRAQQSRPAPATYPLIEEPATRSPATVPIARPAPVRPPATLPPLTHRIDAPASASVAPPPRHDPDASGSGAWLNLLLVGVVFTVGVALLVFTFGRPFLPPNWLP